MKDKNQLSALLSICIIPRVITEIKGFYSNGEESAIKEFYRSALFNKLQAPETGLWHLSIKTLSQLFLAEVNGQAIEFPEEQS
jgi:hypothetical protein